jgi:hypothetical protein
MLPINVMNQIYKTGLMQSKTLAAIFSAKTQEQAEEMLDQLSLERIGDDPTLIMPYQTVAPLLIENVAISKVAMKTPQIRLAAPEILTIGEALWIAKADYLLTETQLVQLREALETPLP